jgi:hypothetical protein
VKNVEEVTSRIKDRLSKIKGLPEHDNLVPLRSKGYKKVGKFSEIFLLSDFLPDAYNLEEKVKNHE